MKRLFLTIILGLFGTLTAQNIWKPINIPGTFKGVAANGDLFSAKLEYSVRKTKARHGKLFSKEPPTMLLTASLLAQMDVFSTCLTTKTISASPMTVATLGATVPISFTLLSKTRLCMPFRMTHSSYIKPKVILCFGLWTVETLGTKPACLSLTMTPITWDHGLALCLPTKRAMCTSVHGAGIHPGQVFSKRIWTIWMSGR